MLRRGEEDGMEGDVLNDLEVDILFRGDDTALMLVVGQSFQESEV